MLLCLKSCNYILLAVIYTMSPVDFPPDVMSIASAYSPGVAKFDFGRLLQMVILNMILCCLMDGINAFNIVQASKHVIVNIRTPWYPSIYRSTQDVGFPVTHVKKDSRNFIHNYSHTRKSNPAFTLSLDDFYYQINSSHYFVSLKCEKLFQDCPYVAEELSLFESFDFKLSIIPTWSIMDQIPYRFITCSRYE